MEGCLVDTRVTVLPGDVASVRVEVDQSGLTTARLDVSRRMLVGATAYPGKPTSDMLAAFPQVRYMRDFGRDGGDADRLPELPAHDRGKMAAAAPDCVVHVSWKDDVDQLSDWLDGLVRPVYLTWWHEPMDDMGSADYRATAARMARIIAAHPRRHLVLGNGPIVSRWWLEHGGDPADWWYEGATYYGVDCYNDHPRRYRTAVDMFGVAARAGRQFGVPWMVPEYGIERIESDPTGEGRARVMRDHMAWLREQPDCLAVGWWDHGGDLITGVEPEQTAWRDALAGGW